ETLRANYAYYAFHTFPQISASLITILSEATKLLVAAAFLILWTKTSISARLETLKTSDSSSTMEALLQYAVPAALYLINNLIYFTVLPHATPILLHVCMLMKLPASAILHHYMIKKQQNIHAWISLALLCVGLIIFSVPSKPQNNSESTSVRWYFAPTSGLVIACISALASINTEKLTKIGDFWASQLCLYAFGLLFSIVAYPLVFVLNPATSSTTPNEDFLPALGVLVIVTALTGLIVAAVLRAKDNILKIIGIATSLITIAISQYLFLPELRPSMVTVWKICGGGVVCLTTWTYSYYSKEHWQHPTARYLPIVNERHEEHTTSEESLGRDMSEKSASVGFFVPDATKVFACTLIIIFFTVEIKYRNI
ncbi:uncharacterized protein LY89DRAFT_759987, partial [Mollisia scopiformis]